jgi:L-ornithine N5-oxygenase
MVDILLLPQLLTSATVIWWISRARYSASQSRFLMADIEVPIQCLSPVSTEGSYLTSSPPNEHDDVLDLLIVGFGPTSLSLAIALHEIPRTENLKVLIVEKNDCFHWVEENLPLGNRMRTNVIQDLVTQRNPTSHFSFINYLHETDNIVAYANLSAVNPPRRIFANYLRWAALGNEALGWVRYGSEVVSVYSTPNRAISVQNWDIGLRESTSGTNRTLKARNVVVATGIQPYYPAPLQNFEDKVLSNIVHSSQFLPKLLKIHQGLKEIPCKIAILGTDDDAIEALEETLSLPRPIDVDLFTPESVIQEQNSNPL